MAKEIDLDRMRSVKLNPFYERIPYLAFDFHKYPKYSDKEIECRSNLCVGLVIEYAMRRL